MDSLSREEFLKHLRDALTHLYDAEYLRQSPLAAILGVANRFDSASALRGILIRAIQELKPADEAHPHSRAWWVYESLSCCYVQRLSQQVVADQLGMSTRQLRRVQHSALEVLADRLCEQFRLPARGLQEESSLEPAPFATSSSEVLSENLAWLRDVAPDGPTDYAETLPAVLDLVRPLTSRQGVRLVTRMGESLPRLAMHPVALKQIILSMLAPAVSQARGGEVVISATQVDFGVEITVEARGSPRAPRSALADDMASLDMARQLVEMCAGRMSIVVGEDERCFRIMAVLPAAGRMTVLIIDDNPDALRLLERYTAGTRYKAVVTSDPSQALQLAESVMPHAIVLDVMMPQVDGWQILGWLRHHPRTNHVPIVVCTILPHEALALSLGACAYVRKPVTRRDFLAALDRAVATS
ncbi:MAG: response regulator [Anaerolineae bacterium]|nr:response regulator [Anaerolineae bacterium]